MFDGMRFIQNIDANSTAMATSSNMFAASEVGTMSYGCSCAFSAYFVFMRIRIMYESYTC